MRSTAAWLTSLLTPLAIACGGGDGADDADGVDDDPLPEPTTHFADEPVAWTTPTSDYVSGYYLAGTTSFDTGSWNVLDLDGDGRPDLVRFTAAGQEGDERIVQFGHPSAPYWEVYLGGEGGFAAEPIEWTTPTSDYVSGYYVAGTTSFDTGSWGLLDLDGDRRPDLVRFTAAGQEGDERIVQFGHPSDAHWEVYLGGEGGFATEPIEWATPTSDYVSGYYVAGNTSFDTGSWALLELTGDRRPDLVRFTAAGQEGDERIVQFGHPSDAHWEVYLGGEGGFATEPVEWATPTSDYVSGYYVAGNTSFDTGSWGVHDVDGDRHPDLVRFTAAGQEGDERIVQFGHPSAPHWEVFRGGADGFAAEAIDWATPTSDYVSGFYSAGTTSFDTGSWALLDLDGDLRVDLIEFTAAGQEGDERIVQFGHPATPRWRVHRGVDGGFADEPLAWTTPVSDYLSGFYLAGTTSFDTGSWGLLDLSGDGSPDLVRFTDAGQEGDERIVQYGHPSASRWDVYVATP